jgi:hypothetical protein
VRTIKETRIAVASVTSTRKKIKDCLAVTLPTNVVGMVIMPPSAATDMSDMTNADTEKLALPATPLEVWGQDCHEQLGLKTATVSTVGILFYIGN